MPQSGGNQNGNERVQAVPAPMYAEYQHYQLFFVSPEHDEPNPPRVEKQATLPDITANKSTRVHSNNQKSGYELRFYHI